LVGAYQVSVADVAGELPALFPVGFTPATRPTVDQVESFLVTADAIVSLRVRVATKGRPAAGDTGWQLAKRYVIESAKSQVMNVVYAGNDPRTLADAVKPYREMMAELLASIDGLAPTPVEQNTRMLTDDAPTRALIVTDRDLDGSRHGHRRGRF
jgi:hypothetical protein